MRFIATLWICCWICCLSASRVVAGLNIIYNYDVSSIHLRAARLTCRVETDKMVKEVVWYKLSTTEARRTVYYFEPPKFNATGPMYKNRVHLGEDSSSLVFPSVQLEDEGEYECRVAVASNVTSQKGEIPEEKSATVKLTVNVPPSDVKMTTFTSGKNMTFTCSSRAKPAADITWMVTRNGATKSLLSAKVVVINEKVLSEALAYFYLPLGHDERGTTVACVIEHRATGTKLSRNETMVPPTLLHPVQMYFDWLGATVPYSEFESKAIEDSTSSPMGLVQMIVTPSAHVEPNATVMVSVTSEGSFPESSFTWWAEELDLRSGKLVRIEALTRSQKLFCLVENPVGRAVMSVQLDVGASDSSNTSSPSSYVPFKDASVLSGAMVAGIAFGSLVLLLFVSFLIYYVMFRRPAKPLPSDDVEGDDFHSYVDKSNPKYSSKTPTGQTKVAKKQDDRIDEIVMSTEQQSLLKSPYDSPPGSYKNSPASPRKEGARSEESSATATTSGYGDDIGEVNGFDGRPVDDELPDDQERAITKHLNDFGENASFVGGYGSTFGLDDAGVPDVVEMESRESPFTQTSPAPSDDESYDSGASGIEGRYTLPHRDSGSWDQFNPNQPVGVEGKPQVM